SPPWRGTGRSRLPPSYARGLPQPAEQPGLLHGDEDHLAADLVSLRQVRCRREPVDVAPQPGARDEQRASEGIRLLLGHFPFAVTVAKASMAKFMPDAEPVADARLAGCEFDDAARFGDAKPCIHARTQVNDAHVETLFAGDL